MKRFWPLGLVILRDPRVSEANNNTFLDMMERYFESSDGVTDARPHYHYQVGVTPSHVGTCRLILIHLRYFLSF